jgi:hypothetical protein
MVGQLVDAALADSPRRTDEAWFRVILAGGVATALATRLAVLRDRWPELLPTLIDANTEYQRLLREPATARTEESTGAG